MIDVETKAVACSQGAQDAQGGGALRAEAVPLEPESELNIASGLWHS